MNKKKQTPPKQILADHELKKVNSEALKHTSNGGLITLNCIHETTDMKGYNHMH